MKTCSKCKTEKPRSEFSKHLQNKDGLDCYCRACKSITHKLYRASSLRKADTERLKAWRAANKDRCNKNRKAWYAANPDAVRIQAHNRRARKRSNGGALSTNLSAKLFKLQRGKCACCGLPLGGKYHLDHIMPLALGGSNTDDNMQLLRVTCNQEKWKKHPVDFMQQRGFLI